MRRKSFSRLAWVGIVAALLIASGTGVLWLERASATQASSAGTISQQTHPLPEHPFEHMGVAGLTPSPGLPENAMSEAKATDLVVERTWGPYRKEYEDKYPANAIPAIYNAKEHSMGPAANETPVWLVILKGWGPPARCGLGSFPLGAVDPQAERPDKDTPQGQSKCTPGQSNAYVIVDAVTGQVLGSWHFGKPVWE